MNYKKEKNENYTLHTIETDRFKTVSISIRLSRPYEKHEAAYLKLLERVAVYNGTKKYPHHADITKELENLYSSNIYARFYTMSNLMVLDTELVFINPKYTEENIYEKAIDLYKEILTNQKIQKNKFNEEIFEIEKENLIKGIKNSKDSPSSYGRLKFDEIFFKGTIYSENNIKNIKTYENMTNEELVNTYKKLFTEYKIDVIITGEVNIEKIKPLIDNLLKPFKQKENTTKDLYIKLKNKEKQEIKHPYETTQSHLFIGCNVNNIKEKERDTTLLLYNTILGGMNNSILFVNVREKNSLCYTVGSQINRYTDSIIIKAGINKKNYNKTKRLIENCLNKMKDKKVIKKQLSTAKKTLEVVYNDFYDSKYKIMDYYYINEFTYIPPIEERRTKMKETTEEEIISLAKNVEINTIFLLEGSLNEEN